MTTLEAYLGINDPRYEYGITGITIIIVVEKNEDIMDHIVNKLREDTNHYLFKNAEKRYITVNTLKII
jgi:hypothetical protein